MIFSIPVPDFVQNGNGSIIIGENAGTVLTTGGNNTALGNGAAEVLTVGGLNTLLGTGAGNTLVDGNANTFIGHRAGRELPVFPALAFWDTVPAASNSVGQIAIGNQYTRIWLDEQEVPGSMRFFPGPFDDLCETVRMNFIANARNFVEVDPALNGAAPAMRPNGHNNTNGNPPDADVSFNIEGKGKGVVSTSGVARTVANLPAAPRVGSRAVVSNATLAFAAANIGSVVVGGGANEAPVVYVNGQWRIG